MSCLWETEGLTNSSTWWLTDAPEAEARLAKLKVNADFVAPCNTSILYPAAGGNMHCFTAVTACAVLDVLGPPYSDPDGRHCTYYREYPFDHFSGTVSSKPAPLMSSFWYFDSLYLTSYFLILDPSKFDNLISLQLALSQLTGSPCWKMRRIVLRGFKRGKNHASLLLLGRHT